MNKEMFLDNICPQMRLTWDFFKSVYGFELSFPGFAETALDRLEGAGCSATREYYNTWLTKYQAERDAELKEVARQLIARSKDEQRPAGKEVSDIWQQKPESSRQKTERKLTSLCERLLKEGKIESPEQFATMVQRGY